MKRFHLIIVTLALLFTACKRKELSTLEPPPQAVRNVAQITEGDYCAKYAYNSEGLLASIDEIVNDTKTTSYIFKFTPIIHIGEVSNPTGNSQDSASTSELEFTKEGYLKREVAKKVENNATLRSVAYTYDDKGHLTQIVQNENDRKYTRQIEWSEGNVARIKNEYFFKTVKHSFYEDITYSYNDEEVKPTNHNPQLFLGDKMPIYPTAWYGTPSKNHISSMHTIQYSYHIDDSITSTESTFNIEYEYDSKGYPTAIMVHNISDNTTSTKKIEYAN